MTKAQMICRAMLAPAGVAFKLRPRHFALTLLLCTSAAVAQSDPDAATAPLPPKPQVAQSSFNPFNMFRSAPAIADAVAQWQDLRGLRGASFSTLSSFLVAHPGWPNERDLRDAAETALHPETESPAQVIAFFQRFPAKTPAAQLRYAEALYTQGQRDLAANAARIAWDAGSLSLDDESRLLIRFNTALTPDDHDARMNRLLWNRAVIIAQRQLPYTSATRRALFDVRLALLSKAPDAEMKATPYLDSARTDAGFVADRATYLINTAQDQSARVWLARPHQFATPPLDSEAWINLLLRTARRALDDAQFQTAYDIARQVGDAYPQGTVIRDRPFSERDAYTSLVWLAGDTALNKLGRAPEAISLFELYAAAGRTSFSQAKGLYWAGRAADQAGQHARAMDYYSRAATFFEDFHGQLAAEKLGRVPSLGTAPPAQIAPAQRQAFEANELVRAATYLGQTSNHADQTLFLRALASTATTDADLALATELGRRLGRTDAGVMAARVTRGSGGVDFIRAGFPTIPVAPAYQQSWTMIHAISRQESNFDIGAVSRTSARGLMQIEPYTARNIATKNGLPYDVAALTTDPAYNTSFGAIYFSGLMTRFNGCTPCAVAAYNAGPGRVNQWIARNGDPRLPSTDVVKWIEAIPFSETRGYVQHVIENAVVYDLLNPNVPNVRSRTPLSSYLGKAGG
jgi:soluble lytic murein transglycosylase